MALEFERFHIERPEDPEEDKWLLDLKYDDWYVLSITKSGYLVRVQDVSSELGIKVNEQGKIRILKVE